MPRSSVIRALATGTAMVALLVTGSSTLAVKPSVQIIEVNYTDMFPVCAFPVQYHEEGTVRVTLHVDRDGDPVFDIARADLTITWTNLTTGASLSGMQRVGSKTTYGDSAAVTEFHGLVYRFVVPGHGAVLVNAGHFVFDRATGTVSLVHGNLTFLDGDYQDLCTVLAGD